LTTGTTSVSPIRRSRCCFAAVDRRPADPLTDLALVAVRGGGVDQPVALLDRGLDRVHRLVRRALEDAEAECGQFDAVAQGDRRRFGVIS
jgi:hypothetical protein